MTERKKFGSRLYASRKRFEKKRPKLVGFSRFLSLFTEPKEFFKGLIFRMWQELRHGKK